MKRLFTVRVLIAVCLAVALSGFISPPASASSGNGGIINSPPASASGGNGGIIDDEGGDGGIINDEGGDGGIIDDEGGDDGIIDDEDVDNDSQLDVGAETTDQVTPPQRLAVNLAIQSGSCAALRARLAELARTGASAAACVEPAAPKLERLGTTAILPAPSWCGTDGLLHFTRTESCGVFGGIVTVIDTQTGAVVGTIEFNFIDYSYTSADLSTWAHQFQIRPYVITGLGAGSSVSGSASCSGACTVRSSSFPAQPVIVGQFANAESFYDTTVTAPGTVGRASTTITWTFTNPAWLGPTNPLSYTQLDVRCDNALPGRITVGCVFPDYIPAVIYSRSGPYAQVARHIGDAQASGLPGAYPNGTALTRLTNRTDIRRNRRTACKPRYHRPEGKSCDEYPFASSNQGAATGADNRGKPRTFKYCDIKLGKPGSTGPFGYSICMVNANQNSKAGTALNRMYTTNRVIANDLFQVWIIP
jgi:hypothetical protein